MLKYLIKNTVEIRVENEDAANELHKEYEQYAHDNNITLSSWAQTYRTKKSGGEIVEEWYICKAVLQFNDPKEPIIPLKDIEYNLYQSEDLMQTEEF